MSHQFFSGVFSKTAAWHNLGEVIPESLPPEEMFRRGGLLYDVVPRRIHVADADGQPLPKAAEGYLGICRADNNELLSVQTDSYSIIQNSQLLMVADALREDTEIEAAVVLDRGRKATFTAEIKRIDREVAKGDHMRLKLVACTSHDGSQAFSLMWVPFRVECANLLAAAISTADASGKILRIRHTSNANDLIKKLPEVINLAERRFDSTIEELEAMVKAPCDTALFRRFLELTYADDLKRPINDVRGKPETKRERRVTDIQGYNELCNAFAGDMRGGNHPGTIFQAYNAVTHFMRHDWAKNGKNGDERRYGSLLFGKNQQTIQNARAAALQLTKA